MNVERSCGAVVFTRTGGEIRYVIIESIEGIFGFPKGHMEAGETEDQTALREIREETGLQVRLLDGFRVMEEYPLPRKKDTLKQVVFFLAEYEDQAPVRQEAEVSAIRLLAFEEALGCMQYENTRSVLRRADAFLNAKKSSL